MLPVVACGDDGGGGTVTTTTSAVTTTVAPGTTTTVTTMAPTTTTTEPPDVFDGRVGVMVADADTRSTAGPDIDLPPAPSGSTYLVVSITVTRIVSEHLTNLFGYDGDATFVRFASGDTVDIRYGSVTGIRFSDPTSITSSSEIIEEAEATLIFEVPEGSQITELEIVYTYRETMDDDAPQGGGRLIVPLDVQA